MSKQSSVLWSDGPVCVCVRKAELFGMAPVSLSVLWLLLLDFQLGYGGILCFVFMMLINNFSEVYLSCAVLFLECCQYM